MWQTAVRRAAWVTIAVVLVGCASTSGKMSSAAQARSPLVIAHRGASGYLPEHTLPAKALAHAMGADFIEQDVVLSRDGVPVVLHDIHLDSTTDVAQRFPERARDDGRFYAIDFDLAELRQLTTFERRAGDGNAVFPTRFPTTTPLGSIPTLRQEIAFIDGLNRSRGMSTGLYIEMKASAFHAGVGLDLPAAVLAELEHAGWAERRDGVFLQSFEASVLKRLRHELKTDLPLIQLIGENNWGEDGDADYDYLRSDEGLAEIAGYADGIGPWIMQLYTGRDADGAAQLTDLVARAHAQGLQVHPFTARADQLPPGITDLDELHRVLFDELGVDGLFTDFPDLTRKYLQQRGTIGEP